MCEAVRTPGAHAEFILLQQVVGRPGVSTTRGVRPVAQELATSRPHTLREVEGIGLEQVVGRPRGFIPKLAVQPITQEQVTGRPAGLTQARARPAVNDLAVGRPNARVKRAVLPIAQDQVVGRPQVLAHALAVAAEQAVGRPVVQVKRSARSITAEQAVGRPSGVRRRIGYGQPIASEQAVLRPVALVRRAVQPIVADQATGRPAAVLFATGRPLVQDVELGRPNGRILRVGTVPVATGLGVTRPRGERLRTARGIPVAVGSSVGRPVYYRQAIGTDIALEMHTSTPFGFFPHRNPMREARASVDARAGDFHVAARPARWQVTA